MLSKSRVSAVLVSSLALFACSRPAGSPPPAGEEAVKVVDIDVGRSVAPDKTIAEKTDSFSPTDTVYVAVKTEGSAPSVTLGAQWTYEDGQRVDEATQTIAPRGPAVTEFHVAKPDGLPAGEYKVEIFLNGLPAGSESFRVG
jgi:hypothetical protein